MTKRKLAFRVILISSLLISGSSFAWGADPWSYVNYIQNKITALQAKLLKHQGSESLLNQIKQIKTLLDQLQAMNAKPDMGDLLNKDILWRHSPGTNEVDTAEAELKRYYREKYQQTQGKPKPVTYFAGKGQDPMAKTYAAMDHNTEQVAVDASIHFEKFSQAMTQQIDKLRVKLKNDTASKKEKSMAQYMADLTRIMTLVLLIQKQNTDWVVRLNQMKNMDHMEKIGGIKSRIQMNSSR